MEDKQARFHNGSAPDCGAEVPASNPAAPQPTANSVSSLVGCHLKWQRTMGWHLSWAKKYKDEKNKSSYSKEYILAVPLSRDMRNIFNDLLSTLCLFDLLVVLTSFLVSGQTLQPGLQSSHLVNLHSLPFSDLLPSFVFLSSSVIFSVLLLSSILW